MLYTVRSFESYRFNSSSSFFFFNDTATTEIYTLSLHDALPISRGPSLRLLPHHRAPRLQDLSDDERRPQPGRSEEHTSELQSRLHLVCRLLLEKKKNNTVLNRFTTI